MRCSSSRSLKSGTAVSNRSATARGGRLSMLSYHTSSLQGAARAVENPDIVASIMAKPRRGDVLDLTIDDLAFGGEGVGRVQGYVIFVRGAVPGDRVRARVVEARSRFGRAVVESLETPSPDRVEAPCPYFGRCGGCRLQHLSYAAQLAFKEKQVRDCLERIGGLGEFELRPILAAPDPYGYRNKMEFTIVRSGTGEKPVIGLHQADRYDVVLDVNAKKASVAVGSEEHLLLGRDHIRESLGGLTFQVSANSFFQTNTVQAERLFAVVEAACGLDGRETVMDLYSGTGAITLLLARRSRWVYGIEVSTAAVADAVRNARENGIENCTFLPGEVRHVLPTLMRDGIRAEVVVADPPRAGFHPKALQALATLGPARLVYVSCNPSTLARDVGDLVRQGYRLEWVEPVDMFPQTPHIEAGARFWPGTWRAFLAPRRGRRPLVFLGGASSSSFFPFFPGVPRSCLWRPARARGA